MEILLCSRASAMLRWLARRRILLVRHGNTGKAARDAERQITDRGREQIAAFAAAYSSELGGVRYSFCSPVARTVTTAFLLSGMDATPVHDLYFGHIATEEHFEVDRALGYAPVGDYLANHAALYAEPARRMVTALELSGRDRVDGEGDVLIVGHAMYLSLLTLEVIKELTGTMLTAEAAAAGTSVVLQANVGEVEGFEISAEGVVRFLQNKGVVDADGTEAQRNDDFVAS